jgi:hypothetical protein
MAAKSRQIQVQMVVVLTIAVIVALLTFIWKIDAVAGVLLGDPRPVILNGVILLLFALGVVQLFRGLRHYGREEERLEDFARRRAGGESCAEILGGSGPSLLGDRYHTIKDLFDRGSPIDHGAISAIMVAEESLQQSLPRFVNNVLILTGVFGTVSSLIFALVGASDVLRTAAPESGMGLLLLGMNTALTTTATAIVCYFFFTFFFHRFADLQTAILGRVERMVLVHVVPEFSFEADTVNHQAKLMIEQVRDLVAEVRNGLIDIDGALQRLAESASDRKDQTAALIAHQQAQNTRLDDALARVADLRDVLVEGFRLQRRG